MSFHQGPFESSFTRVPYEIILLIVDRVADDVKALQNFYQAVRGNAHLLQPVLEKRWQKVTIDDRDLIPVPEDTEFHEIEKALSKCSFGKKWKSAGHGINSLLEEVQPNILAASYVQELTLDMQMWRYTILEVADTEIDIYKLRPTLASFEHSFILIEPHLLALKTLNWDGDLPGSVLTLISRSEYCKKITGLQLQRFGGSRTFREPKASHTQTDQQQQAIARFDSPRSFGLLTSLAIYRLVVEDVTILLDCLPLLSNLQSLVLADEECDANMTSAVCGLYGFVQQLIMSECKEESSEEPLSRNSARLPSTLISLTLIEMHLAPAQFRPYSATDQCTFKSPLRNLSIVREGSELIFQLAASFVRAQLQELTFPGSASFGQHRQHLEHLNLLISKHVSTLSRITILDAWKLDDEFGKNFNHKWQDKFEVCELVLGTSSNTWAIMSELEWQQKPSPVLRNYLDGYDAFRPDISARPHLWGERLQRIRVDDIKSWTLDAMILEHPRFSHLRIIMLQPFDDGEIPNCEPSRWSNGCKHINEIIARRVVNQIYWSPILTQVEEGKVLWNWKTAENDRGQANMMRKALCADDWAFLRNAASRFWNSRCHRELQRYQSSEYNDRSVGIIGRRWNYVTILPISRGNRDET